MPDEKPCVPTGQRSDVSAWTYMGSAPGGVITSAGGGVGPGVSLEAIFVWKRTFSLTYRCSCGGKTADVIVPNNTEYYTHKSGIAVGGGYTTISLTLGLPIPGVLGAIGDALGASIDIAHWWADPAAVDADRPPDPGPDTASNVPGTKLQRVPIAICGQKIDFGYGNIIPWPAPQEIPTPPDTREAIDCPGTKVIKGTSYGFSSGDDQQSAEDGAQRRCMLNAYSAMMTREAADYKCKPPCVRVPAFAYGTPKIVVSWPTHAQVGDKYISLAAVEWTLTLTCVRG
jgi:hypothetical protein